MNSELDSSNLDHEIVHHPKKTSFIDSDMFTASILMASVVIGIILGIVFALN